MKLSAANSKRCKFAAVLRLYFRFYFLQKPQNPPAATLSWVKGGNMEQAVNHNIQSPYLTAAEAAAYLRLEESTLNAMRWRKEGPNWRKHGGKVVYHKDALDHWSRLRDSDPNVRNGKDDQPGDDDARA